jgi:hypothetical protein
MMSGTGRTRCIACGIFREELESLRNSGALEMDVSYLDSLLHLRPERLRESLDDAIADSPDDGAPLVILYGDCHPYMDALDNPASARAEGFNCAQILLGDIRYRELRRAGYFFLIHEWAERWEDIFKKELGLDDANAATLMAQSHSGLAYIDTGILPVPAELLERISAFTSLPYMVEPAGTAHLLAALLQAEKKARSG